MHPPTTLLGLQTLWREVCPYLKPLAKPFTGLITERLKAWWKKRRRHEAGTPLEEVTIYGANGKIVRKVKVYSSMR
jgi:hypothetical protein